MKEAKILLSHILENTQAIEKYMQGISKPEFLKNIQLQDSVIRRMEITGEAVKNLPVEFKQTYLHIPWDKIAGMRDILIHEYFGVDLHLVWDTCKKDISFLRQEILDILEEMDKK